MDKQKFNSKSLEDQISEVNLYIMSYGSLRKACEQLGVPKGTIQSRFQKAGYVFSSDKYIKVDSVAVVEEKSTDIGTNFTAISLTTLDDYINCIKNKLNLVAKNFVEVGTMLATVQEKELYEEKGYHDLLSFSYSELGLSKNQTYNLIRVSNRFVVPETQQLREDLGEFSFSQLVEMVYIEDINLKEVYPEMKVEEIRKKKKELKSDKQNLVFVDPLVLEKNFLDVATQEEMESEFIEHESPIEEQDKNAVRQIVDGLVQQNRVPKTTTREERIASAKLNNSDIDMLIDAIQIYRTVLSDSMYSIPGTKKEVEKKKEPIIKKIMEYNALQDKIRKMKKN